MMLHVICGYPSKSQGTYSSWGKQEFTAYAFVRAVKRRPFNGYAHINQGGQTYKIENNAAGLATAMLVASRGLAGRIGGGLGLKEGAAIVPVPASDHVHFGSDFTGARLARGIASLHEPFKACPNITFTQVMQKATEDGPRDPALLLPYMQLCGDIPNLPIVLVDDVTSTHGHLKAVARLLRQNGREVAGAVCVAQTVWQPPAQMFGIESKKLLIDSWPHNDPGLFD